MRGRPHALELASVLDLGDSGAGRHVQGQLELVVTAPPSGVDEARESRLPEVLSDADAEPRTLVLERFPQIRTKPDGRLMHPARRHAPMLRHREGRCDI